MKYSQSGPSDSELLQKLQQGDEEAFLLLYRRYQGAVYRYALQMSGSADKAEEATQEVFLSVIKKEEIHFDPGIGSLEAYLVGIARNHLLRGKERGVVLIPIDWEEESGPVVSTDALVSSRDLLVELTQVQAIESLRKGILGLPARYREVVLLCDLEEMTYAEAAAALGCPVGTVRSRLHRAHAMLVERLNHHETADVALSRLKPSRCFI
jgi:RNA polymerase sigma-70 factor (ECF subfamily)